MIKKGISTRDLRPFSMDDPFGLGLESPTQARLRQRFRRKNAGRSRNATPAQALLAREQRAAPRATVQRSQQKAVQNVTRPVEMQARPQTKKKSKGGGCFTTLIILGALYAAGHAFIPPIWNAVMQEIILQTGQSAHGQILFAQPTSSKWNDNTLYEVTVEVHAPGLAPYQANIKQALSPDQAARLVTGTWVELRYDSTDLERVAIRSVGVPDPRQVSEQHDQILERQQMDAAQLDPAQILENFRKQTEALKNIPGLAPPRETDTSASPNHQVPRTQAPAAESPVATSKPAPNAPTSPPPVSVPAPSPQPQPQSAVSVPLACLQASACCKIAEGSACASFSSPGTEEKACKRALRNFTKSAEAAGKSCSGLP